MSNRVTIMMSDGTTREVHPDTFVRALNGLTFRASATANGGYKVTTVLEPTREDWTPYEPWMRDVLADDARVSWIGMGIEYRGTWSFLDLDNTGWNLDHKVKVHPDDVPERPAEGDPDEALAKALWETLNAPMGHPESPASEGWLNVAREHIEGGSGADEAHVALRVAIVDVTEEPPVGSQVTDRMSDVWERREGGWALWWPERSGWVADLYEGELDSWPVVRNQAPLRLTTDEDRKRVGLLAEPAPADVDPNEERDDPDAWRQVAKIMEQRSVGEQP